MIKEFAALLSVAVLCMSLSACKPKPYVFNLKDYRLQISKGIVKKNDTVTFWEVPVTLTNMAPDTLAFYCTTFTWEDFYSIDNKKLFIENLDRWAYSNMVYTEKLPPQQSRVSKINVYPVNRNDTSSKTFRIGFSIIRSNGFNSGYSFQSIGKKETTIWSNEITF